jgi:hypothetical protein
MPRSYHVDIAHYAADADAKWVDNLLSHHRVPGVDAGGRGAARRLTVIGIYHIALTRRLHVALDMAVAAAVAMARELLEGDASSVAVAAGVEIRFDRRIFTREIDALVAEAVEVIQPVRRGRPPARRGA